MSAQERHPIDAIFRQRLERAEATPPPSVWAGVYAARAANGGGRAWWFGRLLPGLLCLLAGTSGVLALRAWRVALSEGSSMVRTADAVHDPMAAPAERTHGWNTAAVSPSISVQEAEGGTLVSVEKTKADEVRSDRGPGGSDTGRATTGPGTAGAKGLDEEVSEPLVISAFSEPTVTKWPIPPQELAGRGSGEDVTSLGRPSVPVAPIASAQEGPPQGGVAWMAALRPNVDRSMAAGVPWSVPRPAPYVLPSKEWWVAAEVGLFDLGTRWHGDDGQLVEALKQSEARTSTIAPGIAFGLRWHNGFSLGLGLLHERSERSFHHVDRRMEVSHEIHHFMVTLNDQVIWSDVDTVTHTTWHERVAAGRGSQATLLLPAEAAWQKVLGRTLIGVGAGLALELPIGQQGAMLDRSAGDGGLVAREVGTAEWRARQPAALLGSANISLGRQINEHWSVHAGPRCMVALGAFGGSNEARSLNDRFGVRFGITHHLSPKRQP